MDMTGGALDLSKIPSQPAPPGVTSNFVNPPSRAGSLTAASAVLIALSTIFILLRLYTRLYLTRIFGLSDYLLLAGYSFAVAKTALSFVEITYGLGRHAWDVPLGDIFPHQIKWIWWQVKLYIVSLGCSKLSILGLYPQISPSRTFTVLLWVLVGFVASCTLSTFLWSTLGCRPISNFWSLQAAMAGKCPPQRRFLIYTGVTNVATDFAILVLPVMMMRHLTLPKKKKFGIAVLLASGSFASVISIVRMILSLRNMGISDITYKTVDLVVWSAEVHAVVICGCMPTLRPLIRLLFGKKIPQSGNSAAHKAKGVNRKKHTELHASELTASDLEASGMSNGPQESKHSTSGVDLYDRTNSVSEEPKLGSHKSS